MILQIVSLAQQVESQEQQINEMRLREAQGKALQSELEAHVAIACQKLDIETTARYGSFP